MPGPREAPCSPCRGTDGDHWGTPWPDGSPDGGRPWVRGDATPAPGLESRLPGGQGSGRTVLDGRAQGPGGEHTLLRSPASPGTLTPPMATASHGLHPSSYHETPTLVQQPPRRDSSPPGTTEKLLSSRPQAGNKGRELSTRIPLWAALPPGTSTPNPAKCEWERA